MNDENLASALAAVAAEMERAVDPWWVIGSAAVALHGADTIAADIDLLVSVCDAMMLIERLRLSAERPDAHPVFRSRIFARWHRSDRDVEIMAGLAICDDGRWHPLAPVTRLSMKGIFVPDRAELAAILSRFGRPKDIERRRLLAAL